MVWGIAMVKDEIDIIEHTMKHMMNQVDHVVVLDNGSTDGTREVLDSLDLEVLDDEQPAYYQSNKMSWLAAYAHRNGATWVVPFDADEVWYAHEVRLADFFMERTDCSVVEANLYNHVRTSVDLEGHPLHRMGWRIVEPLSLPKVACRPMTSVPVRIDAGNHNADYGREGGLVVRHFPYRSPEQFVKKILNGAAALALADLPEHTGQHWRQYGKLLEDEGPEALHRLFHEHFYYAYPFDNPTLVHDPFG